MNQVSSESALGEPYDLAYLELDGESHYHKLLRRCPDIKPLRFRDQQYIVRQGQVSSEIYIVLRGSCLIEDEKGGHCVANSTMALIHGDEESPAFVGEMAHLADGIRLASVKSAGATHTLCLQPRHMDVIVNEFPLFTQVLCRQFTARLRESNAALRKLGENLEMQAESTFCTDGHVLYRQGEPADALFQLVDGKLIEFGPRGRREITPESYAFGFLEPQPYFNDTPYRHTVVAESFAAIVKISRESRRAVIRNFPDLILSLYREASIH